jgi:serine protease inhibitor
MPKLMGGKVFTIDLFTKPERVYVSTFVQKNKLDVTKDGMEGASATAMVCCLESACMRMEEYKKITIDRPFSFAVIKMIDDHQWLTLFTGQIFDPITPKKK